MDYMDDYHVGSTFYFWLFKKTIVIKQISLGWHHSSALTVSGQLFTWGLNEDGQLGDGTTTNKLKTSQYHQTIQFGRRRNYSTSFTW